MLKATSGVAGWLIWLERGANVTKVGGSIPV